MSTPSVGCPRTRPPGVKGRLGVGGALQARGVLVDDGEAVHVGGGMLGVHGKALHHAGGLVTVHELVEGGVMAEVGLEEQLPMNDEMMKWQHWASHKAPLTLDTLLAIQETRNTEHNLSSGILHAISTKQRCATNKLWLDKKITHPKSGGKSRQILGKKRQIAGGKNRQNRLSLQKK